MKTSKQEMMRTTNAARHVLSGFLVGSAIGAATALLFAPRSGEETRADIRDKAIDLRDQATETARGAASQIKDNVVGKVGELKERGKQVVSKQLDRVSQTAQTEKRNVQDY